MFGVEHVPSRQEHVQRQLAECPPGVLSLCSVARILPSRCRRNFFLTVYESIKKTKSFLYADGNSKALYGSRAGLQDLGVYAMLVQCQYLEGIKRGRCPCQCCWCTGQLLFPVELTK